MFYTVYKTTNKLNGRYYIGKHKTKNLEDGYMGSGKLLRLAIEKYGIENFEKEILFVFDNEDEMNSKEYELVVLAEETYNLCPGGNGGFGYINGSDITKFKGKKHSEETKKIISEKRKGVRSFVASEEYRAKMSEIMKKKHQANPGFNSRA
jgi:hypothetical protein